MTLGEMIKKYINEQNLSYEEFARRCDISKGYVSMLVNGKNPKTGKAPVPGVETYTNIANVLGMTLNDLFRSIEDAPVRVGNENQRSQILSKTYSVPILGKTAAGVPSMIEQYSNESLTLPDTGVHYDVAIRVEGDSMEPQFHIGDYALIRYQDDVDDGQIAVVCLDDEVTMKRVFHMKGAVQLQSDNPKYPAMFYTNNDYSNIHLVGLVIGVLHLGVH